MTVIVSQRSKVDRKRLGRAVASADRVLNFRGRPPARTDKAVTLSAREYGPDSTLEEQQAMVDRVSVVDAGILLIREMPVQSPFSVHLMYDRIETLSQDWDSFAYVVDLTEAKRPNAQTRAALKERSLRVKHRISHVSVVVGTNELMRIMARLFAYGMGLASVSIHATCAEAIERARRAMER
jgi:hypothetical protein